MYVRVCTCVHACAEIYVCVCVRRLRGPVVLVDNEFTNGPKPNATANETLMPVQPVPPMGANVSADSAVLLNLLLIMYG